MPAMVSRVFAAGCFAGASYGQQVGSEQEEAHVGFNVQECSEGGGCWDQPGSVVMDMQWRWLHDKDGYKNCLGEGDKGWDPELCPDAESCSRQCAIEGLSVGDYSETYGVDAVDGGVKLSYVAPKGAVASRVYLLEDDENYRLFKLKNRELSVTVDVSSLPCGLNGAIYFVEMPKDGGKDYNLNNAGAKYGTGYCDAQCPRGMKFVKNLADVDGYAKIDEVTPEMKHVMSGPVGEYGACCAEMDIFEANSQASSFTAHPCSFEGTKRCKGEEECGNKAKGYLSECDKDGCGMNSYQLGAKDFYGEGKEVDSTKPVTLVTQFHTKDGTDEGDLAEIRRIFIQDGKTIKQTKATLIPGEPDSITDEMCDATVKKFNDTESYNFAKMGGLKAMGGALERGMTLVMSIWDDSLTRMLWLDAEKPRIDKDPSMPGIARGPCPFRSGVAKELHTDAKESTVTFTDVKFGPIGSTFQEAAPEQKFALGEATTPLHLSSGALIAVSAAGVSAGFAAALAAALVARTRRLRRGADAAPLAQALEEAEVSAE